MNRPPHEPPPDRHETVERREIVETREAPERIERREATSWIFLIPLLLVVVVLVWFIFSRGEPRTPGDLELTVPEVQVPTVQEERRIEVEVPSPPPAESPPPQQPGRP